MPISGLSSDGVYVTRPSSAGAFHHASSDDIVWVFRKNFTGDSKPVMKGERRIREEYPHRWILGENVEKEIGFCCRIDVVGGVGSFGRHGSVHSAANRSDCLTLALPQFATACLKYVAFSSAPIALRPICSAT